MIQQYATLPRQKMMSFSVLSDQMLNKVIDPTNPLCPFNKYVGNEAAVRIITRIAKGAFNSRVDVGLGMGRGDVPIWKCPRDYPVRMLLTGKRSVGKTTVGRCYGKLIGTDYDTGVMRLPYIEIDATAIKRREEILEKIIQAMREVDCPLVPERTIGATRHCKGIPSVLFVDEIHAFSRKIMDGFLKLAEPNDGIFEAGNYSLDCRRMTIIGGTTEPEKLTETLRSRFPIEIELMEQNQDALTTIIQNATGWHRDDASRLASLKSVPREALALAKLISTTAQSERCSVEQAIALNAADLGLKEGLSDKALNVLMVLAGEQPNGLSKANLCLACDISKDSFERDVLPSLLRTKFHPSFVTVSSRHKITEAGLDELRVRNLIDY
jgi:hypothetical protein